VIVVDTNVIIAGARSKKGASYRILSAMVEQRLDFLISVPLFLEYEEVLKRPGVVSNLSIAEIDMILNALAAYGKKPRIFYLWRPTLPDLNDDMVLELAIAGSASTIITDNTKDFGPASQFGIEIQTPYAFIERTTLL
jgi:putative PIN family toxin of toxin-antitoxin system